MPSAPGPLRVALVASSLKLAGAEKQTAYQARALLEAGADLRFFHLGEHGYYEPVLRGMGVPFQQIYRPNKPIAILVRLIRAFSRFRPHIVFASQFGDLLQAGIAGRLCNALTLGGVRSDGFYELNTYGRWSRCMLRLAHGLVANSHCARRNLASQGVDMAKIKILPNALDLREFDARSELPPPVAIPADRVAAVAVGTLQPCKRFDRFLAALAVARRKAPALLGVLAGADCGCRPALERQAAALGLAPGHLMFLGECNNVPSLLARAGFLVLCSEYEGFPNVILEAMAASLPVIATRVGDSDIIVQPDRTGYLVDDPDAMADRMAELALSPATRWQLGTEGRKRVAGEYCYEALPGRLMSIFRDFAARHRKRQVAASLRGCFPAGVSSPLSEELVFGNATR